MTVSGTLANLNAALNGLVYTPTTGYSGPDSLHLSLTDPGNSLTGSATVAVTVSPFSPPIITAPAALSVNENSTLVFSTARGTAISFADSFAGSGPETLTLTATDGTLTLATTSGLSFTAGANGSSSMTVSGTLANLNAAVNGLTYTPNSGYSGSDALHLSLTDPGDSLTGSDSVGLTVNPPNQPPTVTAPGTASVSENSSLVFSTAKGDAIGVADVEAGSNAEQLTLTATHGTLKLASTSGLTFISGSNRSASMTVRGTLANLNAALNGLTFTPTSRYVGAASITVSIKDAGDSLTGSATIAVTVNKVSRAVKAAAANETGIAHAEAPQTIIVEKNSFSRGNTVLFTNDTSGNDAINFAAVGKAVVAGTAEATFNADAALLDRGSSGNDDIHENLTPKIPGNPAESPAADTAGSSLVDEAMQWLGLAAALDMLNA